MKYREQHSRQKIAKDSEASLKGDVHVNKQAVNPDSELGEYDAMDDMGGMGDEDHEEDLKGRP